MGKFDILEMGDERERERKRREISMFNYINGICLFSLKMINLRKIQKEYYI